MTTYMLNLVFDMNQTSAVSNGVFIGDNNNSNLLNRSKIWLVSTADNPDPTNPTGWSFQQADSSVFRYNATNTPDAQFIFRVAGLNITGSPAANLIVLIARDIDRRNVGGTPLQARSSPFNVLGNATPSPCGAIMAAGPCDPSNAWKVGPLPVAWTSRRPTMSDRYALTLALQLNYNNIVYDFSHDPEVEIDM